MKTPTFMVVEGRRVVVLKSGYKSVDPAESKNLVGVRKLINDPA